MNRKLGIVVVICLLFTCMPLDASANEDQQKIFQERMNLYTKMETVTQIPWYYYAAIDQYERSIRRSRKDIPKETGLIGIYIKPEAWAGALNPNPNDSNPYSIQLFGGIGLDGNGDGVADQTNDEDRDT